MQKSLNWLIYETAVWCSQFAMTFGWSLRVAGRENMPKSGPVLVIANHQSHIDPPAIGSSMPRRLAYLAKKPLFNNWLFGTYLRALNAVPIDQQGIGIEGIRSILKRLEEGWPVLVFPEGARSETGRMAPLQSGISLLIKRVAAPILPVGIAGGFDAWPRRQLLPVPSPLFLPPTKRTVAIVIGKPRPAESVANLSRQEMLSILAADIQACVDQAEQLRRKP